MKNIFEVLSNVGLFILGIILVLISGIFFTFCSMYFTDVLSLTNVEHISIFTDNINQPLAYIMLTILSVVGIVYGITIMDKTKKN